MKDQDEADIRKDIRDLYKHIDGIKKELRDQGLAFNDSVNDHVLVISSEIQQLKSNQNLLDIKCDKMIESNKEVVDLIIGTKDGKMGMAQKLNVLWNFSAIIILTGLTAIINGLVDVGGWFKHLFDK